MSHKIASNLYQSLGLFLQVDALLAERGVQDQEIMCPVTFCDIDDEADGESNLSLTSGAELDSVTLTWSCELVRVKEDPISTDDEYESHVQVALTETDKNGINFLFDMSCMSGGHVLTWELCTARESRQDLFDLIERLSSTQEAERLLAGDMGHIEHSIALELISIIACAVGGTKFNSERPTPRTMPSPTNVP